MFSLFDCMLSAVSVRLPQLDVEAHAAAPAVLVKATRCCVKHPVSIKHHLCTGKSGNRNVSLCYFHVDLEWKTGIKVATNMRMFVRISCNH